MNSKKESQSKNSGEKSRARVVISGRVQGVFFRAYAREQAQRLRLSGWIRNCPDGTVEAVSEGTKEDIEEFIRWCHQGPSSARVENVTIDWEPYRGEFQSFGVR